MNPVDIETVVYHYFREQLNVKGLQWTPAKYNGRWTEVLDERAKRFICVLNQLSSDMRTGNVGYFQIREKTETVMATLDRFESDNLDESGYIVFSGIAEYLFAEGIRWNHILTLFVFAVELAYDYAQSKNDMTIIDKTAGWLVSYVSERLLDWINNHKGWDGLIDYHNQPRDVNRNYPERRYWKTAVVVGSILALAYYQLAYKH